MKVLFVETALDGHRSTYHSSLIRHIGSDNCILIVPRRNNNLDCKQVIDEKVNLHPRSLNNYLLWLKHIRRTADFYKVDIIHILEGDMLYRFFGLGLNIIGQYPTIATFHHIKKTVPHYLSFKRIARKISYGVVHTDDLKKRFLGISNLERINYPYFQRAVGEIINVRRMLGIDKDARLLVFMGSTNKYKGADILAEALNYITEKRVALLIAGRLSEISREDLESRNHSEIPIYYFDRKLTDIEWISAILASDVVVLPYRSNFTGASGPLTDAAWNGRYVIGPADGSLGEIISEYGLGGTFQPENARDLADTIDNTLKKNLGTFGKKDMEYKKLISEEYFLDRYCLLYNACAAQKCRIRDT